MEDHLKVTHSNPFTIVQEISGRRENAGQSLFFARTKGM
jgi:hypothetical protein